MIRNLHRFVQNFFLHIEINTINLPYLKLPRSYGSHPVSKQIRKLFEKKLVRPLLGLNLVALAIAPVSVQLFQPQPLEPEINVVIPDSVSEEQLSVVTVERTYVLPVERLRYVGQEFHAGHWALDLNSYVGDDIYAFTSGTVAHLEAGTFGLGRYIVLDHGHGLVSVYAHMQSFNVSLGQQVKTGEKIGEVGMTGYTTGPHLHFEVHDNGSSVNPRDYLEI